MDKCGGLGGEEEEELISLTVEFHVLSRAVYWKYCILKGFLRKVFNQLFCTHSCCSWCLNKIEILS